MITDKAKTLCLLEILKEYSDCDNILKMSDIQAKMQNVFDTTIDRRTVYNSIDLLIFLGYDISKYEDNGKGYYLAGRDFEPSEVRVMMDSVYSNNALPAKQTNELVRKLQKQMSVHKRKNYRHLLLSRESSKTANREVFYNIEILDEAIEKKRQVKFHYMQYDFDKTLKPRRDREYVVNPLAMAIADGQYYLICSYPDTLEIVHSYVIPKIKNIVMLEGKASPAPKDFNADDFVKKSIYMFVGDEEIITLKCDNSILDHIITRFGNDISIINNGDGTFNARIKGTANGIIIWAMHFLDTCEIIEPIEIRNQLVEKIKNNRYGV